MDFGRRHDKEFQVDMDSAQCNLDQPEKLEVSLFKIFDLWSFLKNALTMIDCLAIQHKDVDQVALAYQHCYKFLRKGG